MINPLLIRKKKFTLFFFFLLFLIITTAILSPILVSNEKNEWNNILTDKIDLTESVINKSFERKYDLLINVFRNIKQSLSVRSVSKVIERKKAFEILNEDYLKQLSIQLYDTHNNLIVWNDHPLLENVDMIKMSNWLGQTYFSGEKLVTYLSFADTIKIENEKYFLLISIPVEKLFSTSKSNTEFGNIADSLSQILTVAVQIDYSPYAQLSKDGRKYSFALLNNYKNKIATVSFDKPSLEASINQIHNTIWLFQCIIVIIVFCSIGIFNCKIISKIKSRTLKYILIVSFLIALRALLFYLEIPSALIHNSLTDSTNFSSVFGFGIVRSPLEFTITVLFLLAAILLADKYYEHYLSEYKYKKKGLINSAVITFIALIVVLLTLRGFGASIRSVIFDSSIRYFRDFSLLPESSPLLMCFNILILGYCVVLFMMLMLKHLFTILHEEKKNKYFYLTFLFLLFQISGWLFDEWQSEPQGTPLIRIIYLTIIFLLTILVPRSRKENILKFVCIAFTASILSVSYLTYYNSEIERESLKTTAHEITRTNESLVEFMVFQTLTIIQHDDKILNSLFDENDLSSDAFIEWANSMLYQEGIRSSINFFGVKKNYIGGFQSTDRIPFIQVANALNIAKDSLKIIKQINIYRDIETFYGSAPIMSDDKIAGYVSVSAIYDEDYFNYPELPKFLNPSRAGFSSAINFDKLKIFDFHNGELVRSYGDISLSESDINKIVNAKFSDQNEAWMNLQLNNENNLVYLLKINEHEKNKIIAIALEGKNFSWNLSDFFKIFFVHTFIILILLIFYLAYNFKNVYQLLSSYRTRLIGAFLVVSLVPLLLVAVYFRNLTESKNSELVEKRLIELSRQVESYLNYYSGEASVSQYALFEKATNDLDIAFSLFDEKYLIYGSNKIYSDIGLLPQTLSGNVFDKCILSKNQNLFRKDSFENISVSSIYHRAQIGGVEYIIQVSDLFNKVAVPLSDIELDVFLFGIFSLALILLIGFSTLLADQISSPIRKITTATKSVGIGDLNVEVNYKAHGEIKELVDGFNLMVKKIRQSQTELAEMERESAWKEMAKQVAHEIKNPLTPMKLNVQQLIAAYKDKSPKFDSIFEKVTATIISQIETLKNIASEFSNFARMPRLNIEKMNVVSVIYEALILFEEEKRQIKYEYSKDEIVIDSDKDQLKRTIVNLIRNSIQAGSKNISVVIQTEIKNCIIRIHDDGKGISEENVYKVFDNNFTTKKTGMGIGLSMAKKYIESIGGNISIEVTSNEGTTFLIIIPLAE
jgi:two-component system, NtrC family, nitrogen regulation sensor histidine kinase NtrY